MDRSVAMRQVENAHDVFVEDLVPGDVFEYGDVEVTADEIMEFARKYDPLPFHADPVAAAAGPFGGLIASGVQTWAWSQGLASRGLLGSRNFLGGLGVSELRFLAPVRVGAKLRLRLTFKEVHPPKRGRGRLTALFETFDVSGDEPLIVMSFLAHALWRSRGA